MKTLTSTIVKIIANNVTFNWFKPYKTSDESESIGTGFFIDNEGDPLAESKKVLEYLKMPLTEEDYDFANKKIKTMSAENIAKQYEVFLEKVYHENSN